MLNTPATKSHHLRINLSDRTKGGGGKDKSWQFFIINCYEVISKPIKRDKWVVSTWSCCSVVRAAILQVAPGDLPLLDLHMTKISSP